MNSAKNDASGGPLSDIIPFNKVPDNVKSAKRILIVDDNRVVLKVTAAKLQGYGYEVHTAEDGGSAISKLREVQPDLLLLDLNFPPDIAHGGGVPWDGLLLLNWLRRMTEAEHLQVIAITGGALPNYKERCLEAGVLDIFLKPIDIEALVATIRRALRESPRVQQPAPAPARRDGKSERKPERARTQTKANPEAEASEARKRILFVDDESDWRYMGELYLKECGYEVVTTGDAISALAQASTLKPHLIILDLNLPDQGGETLIKLLVEAHPKAPILIYTGMELDETEVSKLLSEGACECLHKGTMEELLNAIARTIGKSTADTCVVAKAGSNPARGQLPSAAIAAKTLPATKSAVDDSRAETGAIRDPRVPEAEEAESRSTSALIIAAEGELRDSLRSCLEPNSFVVNCVRDGEEALEHIRTAKIDLIIFDLAVSGKPLNEFYRALEGVRPELCRRIVFITNDDVHPALDGFVRRVRGVTLWQPFSGDELLETVQAIRNRTLAAPQVMAGAVGAPPSAPH